jgi:predicted small metal-binding protein
LEKLEDTMKKFRCGDVVPGCTATFEGDEADILAAVAAHARADHGLTEVPAELVVKVERAMVEV